MQFLLAAFFIFVGVVAGSSLTFQALISITIISTVVVVYLLVTMKEIAGLIAVAVLVVAVIVNMAMWVAYYMSTNQTWLGGLLHEYILR